MAIIKRDLLKDVKDHLLKKEISLIIGPRQAGKTTLMFLLQQYLTKQGRKSLFLNLDNEADKNHFISQNGLIKKIVLELGKKKGYVFIDEIQRKENAGIFLKGIYDLNLPYKFIVSGSGSLELKEKIHETLVGRKRIFALNTISFNEFVNFKTNYHYEDKLTDFFTIEQEKSENLLKEYLNFGGYPRVILEDTVEEKRRNIDEIYRSYIEKDISYLLKVERVDAFTNLIKILAGQTGQIVNFNKIAQAIGISIQTLKNYFWYGEKTFVVQRVTPYFRNIKKEIIKSPVVYFSDLGLRNYSLGLFGNISAANEAGSAFENLIFTILTEKIRFQGASLHFWRTKDKAEVDFVINYGKSVVPIEVRYQRFVQPEITRSLRSFLEKYYPKNAFVITIDYAKSLRIENTNVHFIPYWQIILKNRIDL
ncbi:MAG: ATP-binding protein [Candidatus Omnitrophota bacterium]